MIVQRVTFSVQWEHLEDILELIKDQRKVVTEAGIGIFPQRFYRYWLGGEATTCTLENEFESLAEMEAFYQAWWALDTTPAFQQKWNTYSDGQLEEVLHVTAFD